MAKEGKITITNMVYGLGAAIVIIGALFKIQHFSIGPITGGVMLSIGLIAEAIVFAICPEDESVISESPNFVNVLESPTLLKVNCEVIFEPDLFKKFGLISLITFIISISLLEISLDEVESTFKLSILIVQ